MEFRLPDVGEGIAEAEIVQWMVGVGEEVQEGDVLATIETDKAVMEMPSPTSGTVARLGAPAGEVIQVGDVLVAFDLPAKPGASGRAEPAVPSAPEAGPGPPPEAVTGPGVSAKTRPKASPAVRRLALELGVELASVTGTGPAGRLTSVDVEAVADAGRTDPTAAASGPPGGGSPSSRERESAAGADAVPTADGPERVAVRGLRRQIAKNMVESWRTVPHIVDWREADATRLIEARRGVRAHLGDSVPRVTFLPLFVKITAIALRRHPLMNASLDADALEYTLHPGVHVGVAVSLPAGLLVPVVHDADRKSLAELSDELDRLIGAARRRTVTPEQLAGGTYTVNNLGAIGVDAGTPIIRKPEVGILGFGRVRDKVVAVDGSPLVRPTLTLSSVGDHRLHDGATLAAFTTTVVELIENPYGLLAELH